MNNAVNIPSDLPLAGTWADQLADKVIATFPDQALYTCAAGISPSGTVHFGNFRDVITPFAVARALKERGKNVRLLFSWDNYDRFRKVPEGVDASFSQYVGMPLAKIPDPWGTTSSYAEHFQIGFENSMREIGIDLDYRYQDKEYTSGRYIEQIKQSLTKRLQIANIMLDFKTEKSNQEKGIDPQQFRETYYPISLYSRFTGKDKTQILDWDGDNNLTYLCLVTNQTETIDFKTDPIVKLPWKVDWPMRWAAEGVHFEAGGKDHATPGSSYDVASVVIREIFNAEPPVFQGYEFVGVQGIGGKMSGSKGGAVSPAMLLEIYQPSLLKWLYLRRLPTQSFSLAFDTEIYRQYDEFDGSVNAYRVSTSENSPISSDLQAMAIRFSDAIPETETAGLAPPPAKIPFKQAVALGQITQWNAEKLIDLVAKLNIAYDPSSVEIRLGKARAWLERYNPDEIIRLNPSPLTGTFGLWGSEPERLQRIVRLREYLETKPKSVSDLETMLYDIPKTADMDDKQKKVAQRAFFKDVYQLLISADAGPRLSTFLWAVDREKVLELLGRGFT